MDTDKLIHSFNTAKNAGHPDPIGLIARGKIKTGLAFDGEYKGAVGSFGVNSKQAQDIGYSAEELELTDTNLSASIEVDLKNYRQSNDVNQMHLISNGQSNLSNGRYMKRMEKEKNKLKKRMVFNNEGDLERIEEKPEKEEKPKRLDQPKETVSGEKEDQSIVLKKENGTTTADDIIEKTHKYEFQASDKDQISSTLKELVEVIVNEIDL